MARVLLDGNIYDLIALDDDVRSQIIKMIENGQIEIVVSPVVADELAESPFKGVPDFFPVTRVFEAVAVAGIAKVGQARVGGGETYSAHLGGSRKSRDAIIADTADAECEILVSEDKRCRSRLNENGRRCRAVNYCEFKVWLNEIDSTL